MPRHDENKRAIIIRRLEEAILTGCLPPGIRLPEMRLGRELGVSQAIAREALQELERRGLVVKRPNEGSYVVQLAVEDLIHIYQLRQELESLACALAAAHVNAPTIAALQACIAEMRAAAETRDFLAYSRADVRFHRILWASQPNRFLEKSLEAVCLPLFAYDQIRRTAVTAMDFYRVARQHELILQAIRAGDPDFAARIMRRMMRRWLRIHLSEFDRIRQYSADAANAPEDPFACLRAGSD